jgi:hypothetical protein
MSWVRIATFVAGAGAIVAGFLVPAAGAALVPAGAFMLGLATKGPQ